MRSFRELADLVTEGQKPDPMADRMAAFHRQLGGGGVTPPLFDPETQVAGGTALGHPAFAGDKSVLGLSPIGRKAMANIPGLPIRPPVSPDSRDSGPLPVRDAGPGAGRVFSGFRQHAHEIHTWALKSPENLACILVSAPLSAMTPFNIYTARLPFIMKMVRAIGAQAADDGQELQRGKVFDVLKDVDKRLLKKKDQMAWGSTFGLKNIVRSRNNAQMKAIESVWNKRHWLFEKFTAANQAMRNAAERGSTSLNDYAVVLDLYRALAQTPEVGIHGFQRVKAGFAIQLALNVQGCIDVHNEKIYQDLVTVLVQDPDLQAELRGMIAGVKGSASDTKIQKYMQVIELLHRQLGVDSGWLWDLWVDWVAQFHRAKFPGNWADAGPAFDPADPLATMIRSKLTPTDRVYRSRTKKDQTKDVRTVPLQLAAGDPAGMAVSQAHPASMVDPDQTVRQAAEDPDQLRLAMAFGQHLWTGKQQLRDKMQAAAKATQDALRKAGVKDRHVESRRGLDATNG